MFSLFRKENARPFILPVYCVVVYVTQLVGRRSTVIPVVTVPLTAISGNSIALD